MYQSIYYDYSTYTYHLRDDKQGWLEFQFQPTYWKRVNEYQEGARPVLTGGYAIPTNRFLSMSFSSKSGSFLSNFLVGIA